MVSLRRVPIERGTRIKACLEPGGESVSRLDFFDLRMRVGSVTVRCGGIGSVGTNRSHRLKGYSRMVLDESIALMQEEGYHLSVLFGIPDYYHRFGFVHALIDSETTVNTRDAERAELRYPVRDFRPDDAPSVVRLYRASHGLRTGSIVRDPSTWTHFRRGSRWTDRVGAFVVTDASGMEILGYCANNLDVWRFGIGEVGYSDPSVLGTLIAESARRAQSARVETVLFHAPPDDPLVEYCKGLGCETRTKYGGNTAGMARIVDQSGLLQCLRPSVIRRLGQENLARVGALPIATDLGEERLLLGDGLCDLRVEMPQCLLTQLILGYRSVESIALESSATIPKAALSVLETLFPAGFPYNWPADRF